MNEYRVVLDTNILVSYVLNKRSGKINGTIIELINEISNYTYVPVYSEEIEKEYIDVLHRKSICRNSNDEEYVNNVLSIVKDFGIVIEPRELTQEELIDLEDEKDKPFLEAIITLNEMLEDKPFENYLITGNIQDFPTEPFIIKPNDFINILQQNTPEPSYER